MSGSPCVIFFPWFHEVSLDYLGRQIPDLHISHRFDGRKFGFSYLITLIGMDFGIKRFWLITSWFSWTDSSGSQRNQQGSERGIALDLVLNSKVSRRDGFLGSPVPSEGFLRPFIRCIVVSFLLLYYWRFQRVKAVSSRIDQIATFLEFGLLCISSIWKFLVLKSRDSSAIQSQNLLSPFVSFLSGFLSVSLSGVCTFLLHSFLGVSYWGTMSQSSLLGKDSVEKSLGAVVSKMRIKIPKFDNSALIKGYAKTMIGRCMNPRKQDMKGLLLMFPRICQVEGRVAGADLGLGRFQLDFDEEEDIAEVLKMEPFHFDGWMVSLVRWKPSVDPTYPSTLIFWVRVLGIPIEYWAEPTFATIGDGLGKVIDVDINEGRIQVIINGFKPLCFETIIEFDNGEETPVSLRYERLYGYCSYCFSLCHDVEHCEKKHGIRTPTSHTLGGTDGAGAHNWSYKGVVIQDRQPKIGSEGKGKGIATGKDREEERIVPSNAHINGYEKGKQSKFVQGEGSSRYRRFSNYANFNDHRFNEQKKLKAKAKEVSKVKVVETSEGQAVQSAAFKPKKIVRKSLVFEVEAGGSSVPQVDQTSDQTLGQKEHASEENQLVDQDRGAQPIQVHSQPDLENGEITIGTTCAAQTVSSELEEMGNVEDTAMNDHANLSLDSFPEVLPEALWDQADGNFMFQENETFESLGTILEEAGLDEIVASEKGKEAQAGKKKNGKGVMLLSGANSRKRNVQVLVSPRKRSAPKDGTSTGNSANPKNQDKEKGNPGGSKPPKPSA